MPGKKNLDGWVRSAGRGEFWNLANCRVGCCGEGGSGIGCGGSVCVEAWWACGWVALAVECSAGWQRFVPGRRVLIRMSVRRVRENGQDSFPDILRRVSAVGGPMGVGGWCSGSAAFRL